MIDNWFLNFTQDPISNEALQYGTFTAYSQLKQDIGLICQFVGMLSHCS